MYKIRLIKGKSFTDGKIKISAANPETDIEDDEYAKRLIATGYFAEVPYEKQEAPSESSMTGHLDAKQLEEMSTDDLRKLAADMGIDTAAVRKKSELISAISAVEVEAGEAVDLGVDGNE